MKASVKALLKDNGVLAKPDASDTTQDKTQEQTSAVETQVEPQQEPTATLTAFATPQPEAPEAKALTEYERDAAERDARKALWAEMEKREREDKAKLIALGNKPLEDDPRPSF